MSLFQSSVLKKFLSEQDQEQMNFAFEKFVSHFHNPIMQNEIRNMKEEEYQDGFLNDLFVNILGYTKRPQAGHNLIREKKNETDGKKADGAILKDGGVIAVIELKGTGTIDLGKITTQAFNYKNNQRKCVYVITSNFEKMRFFIHNAVEYLEFNLFTLTFNQFQLLWLCIQKDNLLRGIPQKVLEDSLLEENEVTKRLYEDYSSFKSELWHDVVTRNTEVDELLLYKKSQKLLDRFLFIFFAEDKGLLPPNSISAIIQQWEKLKELDEYRPLYKLFQKYFGYMNDGYKGAKFEIPAYNGGLFKPDGLLDGLTIDDELLRKHCLKLSEYDFDTEVDTNILGHIFEHSLNDLENVRAQLAGEDVDKKMTKRKKEGVFYTPKYITKYIVDNTLGALCEEKKVQIGINEDEFAKERKGRRKDTLKKLDIKLKEYREWLLQLTICDPACGSGAFLNQALEFLIAEHHYLDQLEAKLFGGVIVFQGVENHILEKNIHGVDINEESVEIARLSLWLRTARKGRKLNSLSNNIKLGNSLIDDPNLDVKLAFNWELEFPQVFEKGGFDVVIGNPPYVNLEKIKQDSEQLACMNYATYSKRGDLYCLFVERGYQILRKNGIFSYIMPNKWLQAGYGKELRKLFLDQNLITLIDFGDLQIFEGATTYPCIFISKKAPASESFSISILHSSSELEFEFQVRQYSELFKSSQFDGNTWVISSSLENNLLERLSKSFKSLSEVVNGEAKYGIKFGLTEAFLINDDVKKSLIDKDPTSREIIGPLLRGRNITRYGTPDTFMLDHIILASFGSYKYLPTRYPAVYQHLQQHEERLKKRGQCNGSQETDSKPFPGQHHWVELDNNPSELYLNLYRQPKIMYQKFQVKPCFIYDEQGLFCNDSMWIIPTKNIALLGVLNSKMGWWLIKNFCTQIQNGYQLIWRYFGKVPMIEFDHTSPFDKLVTKRLSLQKNHDTVTLNFIKLLQSEFALSTITKKLKNWPKLDFKDFLDELKKKKVKMRPEKSAEWLEYFNKKNAEASAIQIEMDSLENQIDKIIYDRYKLSEEERQLIENA